MNRRHRIKRAAPEYDKFIEAIYKMPPCIEAIFVYGTLQRGEVRERCWPRKPVRIEWATIRGQLRDLGEYPALVDGEDLILGELWHIAKADMTATLATLDVVEWFGQDDHDLYTRETVTCRTLAGEEQPAYTYRYARLADVALSPIIIPGPDGFCHWTSRSH
ncbi:MAG: gamma-glutamylcyclotransferase [Planctomycetia bacterium]|nr:gamma-glutamylcyclotransferase [Planctomycetia bacterium]